MVLCYEMEEFRMKARLLKMGAVAICIVFMAVSMTSCGIFFDDENNFVGLNNIFEFIYGEGDDELVDTGVTAETDNFGASYGE